MFTDRWVCSHVFWVFPSTDALFNVRCGFTSPELTANCLSPACLTNIFSVRHLTAGLGLGPRQPISILLGALSDRKITSKEHKNVKTMALGIPREGHLFTPRAGTGRPSFTPF